MRWTIGKVVSLLKEMRFENVKTERVVLCENVNGRRKKEEKLWVIRGQKDGSSYEGVGINARLAFEDLIEKWFKNAGEQK